MRMACVFPFSRITVFLTVKRTIRFNCELDYGFGGKSMRLVESCTPDRKSSLPRYSPAPHGTCPILQRRGLACTVYARVTRVP